MAEARTDDNTGWAYVPAVEIYPEAEQSVQQTMQATKPSVVTRTQLEAILKEQDLQSTNLVDPKTAVRIGQLAGAHLILSGKVEYYPQWTCFRVVSCHLISVETGAIVYSYDEGVIAPRADSKEQAAQASACNLVGRAFCWHLQAAHRIPAPRGG